MTYKELEAPLFDERQEFSVGYEPIALIGNILLQLVLAAITISFAMSFYSRTTNSAALVIFAINCILAFTFLAFACGELCLLVTKHKMLFVDAKGITRYHPFFGPILFPWSQIGTFGFHSTTNPRTNKSYIFLHVLDNTPEQNTLLSINVDTLATPGPDVVFQLEQFAAEHRRNHPERFVAKPISFWTTNKNRIVFGLILLALFGIALIAPSLMKTFHPNKF